MAADGVEATAPITLHSRADHLPRYRAAMPNDRPTAQPEPDATLIAPVWPCRDEPRRAALPLAVPLALYGTAASREIEQRAQACLAAHTLMRRAGAAVARLARAVAPHARAACIVAGPGNNGGDGLDAAIHLQAAGWVVTVHHVGAASGRALPPDAEDALQRARLAGVEIIPGPPSPAALARADVVIDALLGLGVTRAPQGDIAQAIARINDWADGPGAGDRLVLSVDLPSGLDADTGHLDDPAQPGCCVRARHTISLLTLKPSLFTAHGRDQAGSVWFCDLGVAPQDSAPTAWLNAPAAQSPRLHAEHKGSYGNVAVLGGASGMTGAAWLAARTALHAGAGRVHVQLLAPGPATDAGSPELMVRPAIDWQAAAAQDWVGVAGCGGGEAIGAALPQLLGALPRLVLDADALNAVARDPALQALTATRAGRGWATVLTPHPLEAARLLATDVRTVQAHRLAAAHRLAERFGSVVVLKGSGSVIAAPGAAPWINPTGNARLGTAGTGDVLAGWIGGLWAAAEPRGWSAEQAARQAVLAHGWQADCWPAQQALTAGALASTPSLP